MSLQQKEELDAMGLDENGNLQLLLIDEMSWWNKKKHLQYLQDKINCYLEFIESKQFTKTYPDKEFSSFIIHISFLYKIPKKCSDFLEEVNRQLISYNISVTYEIEDE